MLTVISGNNRDGDPCALNKVGDIFQCDIPPFQTEGLIDLGKASQEKRFLLGRLQMALPRVVHFVEKCVFGVKRKITVPTVPNDIFILIIIRLSWYSYKNICTRTVTNCTTYTQGKASSELAEAVTRKSKGDSRSQNLLFLAGLRDQMLGSVKATATGSAGVTVSMTSEDSAGYGKCDSDSHLNSPKSGSAKSHQLRSSMQGVCADNHLNKKANSGFVQTTGKEKGPRPALRVIQLLTCEEANELHHNSYLQATDFAECQWASQALGSMPLFFISRRMMRLSHADIDSSPSCSIACRIAFSSHGSTRKAICLFPRGKFVFYMCCTLGLSYRCLTMYSTFETFVKQRSPAVLPTLTGPLTTNDNALIEVAMSNYTALIGRGKPSFTQTRPEFIDTYWIIPEYETTPYGKVSFTRQDRCIFIALFKDSRLIWAGRKPVNNLTENVICTQLQKVGVKRFANPTSSVKGTESRLQFNQSHGLLVRKMPHEGIEEISIPQGMVKITPPSAITEIVTVQGVAHV